MQRDSRGIPDFFTCSGSSEFSAYFASSEALLYRFQSFCLLCGLYRFSLPSKSELLQALYQALPYPDWLIQESTDFAGHPEHAFLKMLIIKEGSQKRRQQDVIAFMKSIQTLQSSDRINSCIEYLQETPDAQRHLIFKLLCGEKKSVFDFAPVFCEADSIGIASFTGFLHTHDNLVSVNQAMLRALPDASHDLFPAGWKSLPILDSTVQLHDYFSNPYSSEDAVLIRFHEYLFLKDRKGRVMIAEPRLFEWCSALDTKKVYEILLFENRQSEKPLSLSAFRRLSGKAIKSVGVLFTDFYEMQQEQENMNHYLQRYHVLEQEGLGQYTAAGLLKFEAANISAQDPDRMMWLKCREGNLFGDINILPKRSEYLTLHFMYYKIISKHQWQFTFGMELDGKWKGMVSDPENIEMITDKLREYAQKNFIRKQGPVVIVKPGFTIEVEYFAASKKGTLILGSRE